MEWKVGQFDPAGFDPRLHETWRSPFQQYGLSSQSRAQSMTATTPAPGLETEWRNYILCDEDREMGIAQAPISIEPSVQRCRVDLLAVG
jgi:hypothetical protein